MVQAPIARRLQDRRPLLPAEPIGEPVQDVVDLFLKRRTHPRHRNVKELHITDAGLKALQAAETVITELEQHVRDALGTEQSEQLRMLLDTVIQHLSAAPTHGAG